MKSRAQSSLIEIDPVAGSIPLKRVPLVQSDEGVRYHEDLLEDLLFNHPECLPIAEIDNVYAEPVPACRQLTTQTGGILDAFYITPNGRIVIVEAKLWRNPQAKREVVGQILDYASTISRWDYEDLEREVLRARGAGAKTLFEIVQAASTDTLDEADFVDELSKSLKQGRFLLLVCADGIREGLADIAEFLERYTSLDLSFGLVEVAIYDAGDGRRIVHPRVLAKTVTLKRHVIKLFDPSLVLEDEADTAAESEKELTEDERQSLSFWQDLITRLRFDDAAQTKPNPLAQDAVYLSMPQASWVTLENRRKAGAQRILFTCNSGEPGESFYRRLYDDRYRIEDELGVSLEWETARKAPRVVLSRPLPDLDTSSGRADAMDWFVKWSNPFVNAFRPRVQRYLDEL